MIEPLPPLIRLPVNHYDPSMVERRKKLTETLIQEIQKVLDTDSTVKEELASLGVTSVMVGGSAALQTPRHPQDIDLYLDGTYDPHDKENGNKRLQAIRMLMEHAVNELNVTVDHINVTIDHVYVRDDGSRAAGLQKISLQAVFEPHGAAGQSLMAPIKHPIHMPFKIEVHHEREQQYLPSVPLGGNRGADGSLKAIDPRMIAIQKLDRIFIISDTMKGTDILDIAHLIDQGVFDPADPLMRKLGIAVMTSRGRPRNPVSMDFLIPRNRDDEIAMLREDLKFNISRELLDSYSDDDLADMIKKVREAILTMYPLQVPVHQLAKPICFEDAVILSPGEKQFMDDVFKGKALGSGAPRAMVHAELLFNDIATPPADIIQRINRDEGMLAEIKKTNACIQNQPRTVSA